ncbi:MAG: EAL domain-containing protein [Roseburia sp.]
MRYWYIFIMVISTIILLYCIIKASKDKKILAKKLRNLLIAAVFSMIANIGLLLSQTEGVSNVVYTFFFISFDWLIYNLLAFTVEYTNYKEKNINYQKILCILLGIDTLSFLLHLKFGHAFGIERFEFSNGVPYFHVINKMPYDIHLLISYVMLLIVFGLFAHKIIVSPNIYKRKYYVILFILVMVMLLNALFVFTKQPYDISMLLFAIGGTLIYYYALIYMPNDLLDDTLSMVVQGMDDAVVLLDVDGNCIYHNMKADTFLKLGLMTEEEKKIALRKWTGNQILSMCGDFVHDCTETVGNETVYLRIIFHHLSDNKNQYLGSFLTIRDRTIDAGLIQKEHYRATHDQLTGLYNREYFFEMVQKCLDEHPNERFLMICSDVRHFKLINDIFGAESGDELLLKIAQAIQKGVSAGEVYGRLENDRFGILIRKRDYHEQTLIKGPREVAHIESDYSYPVYFHIGVYEITNPKMPVSIMCDRALLAIATIKDDYQKKIAYYNDTIRNNVLAEQKLTGQAIEAMHTGQIQIYLQPQVNEKGEMKGAEALVRWIHPERGMIPPEKFIRVFEKNSLIVSLDQFVWELACIQLQKWKKLGREDLYISVNISPKDFYYMDVTQVLTDLVKRYGISAENLRLEIKETTILSHLGKQMELVSSLQKAGFIIALDDFGGGYSSLNMLKETDVDILKIDMEFWFGANLEEKAKRILKMVVDLSKDLNLTVITEGVETEEQVQFLKEIGCHLFQGYYFESPMPVQEFEEKYIRIFSY